MGIECATGDTYCDEGTNFSLESIYAAEPVIDLAISPTKRVDQDKLVAEANVAARRLWERMEGIEPHPFAPAGN